MLAQSGTTHLRADVRLDDDDDEIPDFDELYRRNFRFTWSVLRRMGVPDAAIEDAAQEVWVIVHRRLDALESPRAARSWLFQIARRVAARHRRGERRSQRKLDALSWIAPRRSQPHAERDSVLTVEQLLDGIDERKRVAFVLSELEGWTAPEIAKAAGTNPNTVYSRIRLARAELQAGWRSRCPEDDLDEALAGLRAQTRPPPGAAKRAWVLLVPKLALGSKSAVTATASAVAGWKLYVAGAVVLTAAAAGGTALPGRSQPSREPAAVAADEATESSAERSPAAPESAVPVVATEARPAVEEAPESAPAVVEPPEPTVAASGPRAPTRSSASSTKADAPGLADETGLLTAAQTSLAAGKPEQALSELRTHHRRFPKSALADLRALLEIKALCAAGRQDQARATLRRAEESMASSALLPKMRGACGE